MSFFNELKRRNVIRVGIAYVVVGWLVLQFADVVLDNIDAPSWVFQAIMLVLAIGLPLVLVFAWAFEMTPEGIKKEKDVDRSQSVTTQTSRKLDRTIIVILVLALAYFIFDELVLDVSQDVVVDRSSIAVLPFANRSSREEDAFFAEGIHDDLLTRLAKIGSLKVISRTSMLRYSGSNKSIPEIAGELDVGVILEGGIQRSGNQVRINVQLIDAKNDRHLWAENYDRELTAENLFAIQSDITTAIVGALSVVLSEAETVQLQSAPTTSLEAYGEYVLGRQALISRSPPDLMRAREHFEKAVALDPDYALAWLGIADSLYLYSFYAFVAVSEFSGERQTAVNRALALDPLLGEAHTSLAALENDLGEPGKAEASFHKAIELNPNNAQAFHWLAILLRDQNHNEEALVQIRKAVELNPLEPMPRSAMSGILQSLGRDQEAMEISLDVLRTYPDYTQTYNGLIEGHINQGQLGKAAQWADEADRRGATDSIIAVQRCLLFLDLADDETAEHCFDALVETYPTAIMFRANLHSYRHEWAEYAGLAPFYVQLPGYAFASAHAYQLNDEKDKAGQVMREHYPQYFIGEEIELAGDYPQLAAVLFAAVTLMDEGGDERAKYLIDQALATMRTMPHTGFNSKNFWEVWAHLFRGDRPQAIAALKRAINAGWRNQWWHLREPFFDPMLQEPEWVELLTELEADIARQRQWYENHKDESPF
jgi:TolB-like protein/Tfp pilus assembly protein PilF